MSVVKAYLTAYRSKSTVRFKHHLGGDRWDRQNWCMISRRYSLKGR